MDRTASILITGGDFASRLAETKKYGGLEFDVSKIDEIREIQHLTATGQSIIITHAEKLSEEAQNALLKTLEEGSGQIILLAPNEECLLSTVVSRCFVKNLSNLSNSSVLSNLSFETIKTREEALEYIDGLMATRPYSKLRQLFLAKKYLKANCNVHLVLETLPIN